MEMHGFEGRATVVVGAGGGGIGTAIATDVARAGGRVIAVDRDEPSLARVVEAIEASGGHVTPVVCDAREEEAVARLFEQVSQEDEELFGLVNVVGGLPLARWRPLLDYEVADLESLLETNLHIALRTSIAFARARRQAGGAGSIVQIASIAALQGMPFGAGYSASKAALLSLTRTMALEWGTLGLRVNAVAPGTIRVPSNEAESDPERDRHAIPLGRQGIPSDIAGAVLFLLSDLAQWITGQVLAVDGGVTVKPSYLDDEGLPVFVQDEAIRRQLRGL